MSSENFAKILEEMVGHALEAAALVAVEDIVEVTPRDLERPPRNINRKDGKRPIRKRGVTSFGGNFYPQVTGNLKKSIGYERSGKMAVRVGTEASGPASKYARAHEFGLPNKNVPPRPYISRPYTDSGTQQKILREFEAVARKFLSQ